MLTILTALVSCTPEALDQTTDPGRVVFYCRDERTDAGHRAPELHVSCSGALSERVLRTILAGDRVNIAGTAELIPVHLSDDVATGRLEIEATDVRLVTSRADLPTASDISPIIEGTSVRGRGPDAPRRQPSTSDRRQCVSTRRRRSPTRDADSEANRTL
jgi:hypothetical protein